MLRLYHDYTSPGSAVAALRLQRLVDDGIAVTFVGFEAVGVDAHLPLPLEVLAEIGEMAEAAAAEGLSLRRPASMPPTARAHVLGELAEDRGLGPSWRRACYRSYWEDGVDLAHREALRELAERVGLARDEVDARLEDPRRVAELRRRLVLHRGLGVGGVPVLLAHGTLVPALIPEQDLRALADQPGQPGVGT